MKTIKCWETDCFERAADETIEHLKLISNIVFEGAEENETPQP
jgi:hypothetical protein